MQQHDHAEQQRDDRPRELEWRVVDRAVHAEAVRVAAHAVLPGEVHHQHHDKREEEVADPVDDREHLVHGTGDGRRADGHPEVGRNRAFRHRVARGRSGGRSGLGECRRRKVGKDVGDGHQG